MKKKRVYISGKITGTTDYLQRFNDVEKELKAIGYEVINPAKVNACVPQSFEYLDYMDICFKLLEYADIIYMMKGWQDSNGATIELEKVKLHNKLRPKNSISIIYEEEA